MKDRVACSHPMLDELRRLDRETRLRFPAPYPTDPGLGDLGLILRPELERWHYHCTPLNCWTFAGTGGDGVHFSLVAIDDAVRENSPVVITAPAAFPGRNFIGGENLLDFLCLGMYRGYFCLEQLAYDPQRTLRACTDPSWQPSQDREFAMGFGVSEHQGRLLALLVKSFGLRPWSGPGRFEALQARYAGSLGLPPGFSVGRVKLEPSAAGDRPRE
jgi:hypothetical protein